VTRAVDTATSAPPGVCPASLLHHGLLYPRTNHALLQMWDKVLSACNASMEQVRTAPRLIPAPFKHCVAVSLIEIYCQPGLQNI
jgi:hypothetical protein